MSAQDRAQELAALVAAERAGARASAVSVLNAGAPVLNPRPRASDQSGDVAPQDPTSPRPRVLVAEDEPDVRALVAYRLLSRGYDVLQAADGKEALELALADPPDAAIVDVMMPELNGFELVKALRAHAPTAAMPIIVLSARAGQADADFALRQGATAYFRKPFRWPELHDALRAAMGELPVPADAGRPSAPASPAGAFRRRA